MGKVKREPLVTIGAAAAAAGLTPKAVRLYESRGVLAAPPRNHAGYRHCRKEDIARLRFVAAARRIGLRVDQTATIVAAASPGQRPCRTTRALIDERLTEIDRMVEELTAFRSAW